MRRKMTGHLPPRACHFSLVNPCPEVISLPVAAALSVSTDLRPMIGGGVIFSKVDHVGKVTQQGPKPRSEVDLLPCWPTVLADCQDVTMTCDYDMRPRRCAHDGAPGHVGWRSTKGGGECGPKW